MSQKARRGRGQRLPQSKPVPRGERGPRPTQRCLDALRNPRRASKQLLSKVTHAEITQTVDGGVLGRRLTASENLIDGLASLLTVQVGAESLPVSSARGSVFCAK